MEREGPAQQLLLLSQNITCATAWLAKPRASMSSPRGTQAWSKPRAMLTGCLASSSLFVSSLRELGMALPSIQFILSHLLGLLRHQHQGPWASVGRNREVLGVVPVPWIWKHWSEPTWRQRPPSCLDAGVRGGSSQAGHTDCVTVPLARVHSGPAGHGNIHSVTAKRAQLEFSSERDPSFHRPDAGCCLTIK